MNDLILDRSNVKKSILFISEVLTKFLYNLTDVKLDLLENLLDMTLIESWISYLERSPRFPTFLDFNSSFNFELYQTFKELV